MSTGIILLTVLVTLFLVVIVLPIVGGGICGSVILMRDALRRMWATRREPAPMENRYAQKPYLSYSK
jgi:hypothetical protein